MSFGKKLKSIRIRFNLTQIDMAERLIMDQSAYSRYETDKTNPSIEIVKRVSEIFSVDINWLLEIENNPKAKFFYQQYSQNNNLDDEIILFMLDQQNKLTDLLEKLRKG